MYKSMSTRDKRVRTSAYFACFHGAFVNFPIIAMQRIITVEKFHSLVFRVCNWMDQLDGFNNPRSRWRENGFDPGRKFHFERGRGMGRNNFNYRPTYFRGIADVPRSEIPNYSLVPGQNFQLIKVRASNPIPFSVNLPPVSR